MAHCRSPVIATHFVGFATGTVRITAWAENKERMEDHLLGLFGEQPRFDVAVLAGKPV